MTIIYKDETSKIPDVDKAVQALKDAYETNDSALIAEAKENATATVKAANLLARKNFYLEKLTGSSDLDNKVAIVTAGYIEQTTLKDRANKQGIHIVETGTNDSAINVYEVNRLIRYGLFSDDIEYRVRKFRGAVVAYVVSEFGKDKGTIEDNLGFDKLRYLSSDKTSMNAMRDLLQDAIDEIVFIPNDKNQNKILATKHMVKLVAYLIATRTPKYGVKFVSTENLTALIVDIIWAVLNNRTLSCKYDDIEF